jgi:hypothetical protein
MANEKAANLVTVAVIMAILLSPAAGAAER